MAIFSVEEDAYLASYPKLASTIAKYAEEAESYTGCRACHKKTFRAHLVNQMRRIQRTRGCEFTKDPNLSKKTKEYLMKKNL